MKSIDVIGKNTGGGFTHTPFGSTQYAAFWTVGGENMSRFECGSNHEDTGATMAPEDHPSMIFTHHTIWFRGDAPSEEEHRERLLNKNQQN